MAALSGRPVVVVSQIAPPIPTIPFFSEAASCHHYSLSVPGDLGCFLAVWPDYDANSLLPWRHRKWLDGLNFRLVGWCNSAIRCSGDRNLRNTRICNFLRGWVSGNVWIPIYNLVALSNCLWSYWSNICLCLCNSQRDRLKGPSNCAGPYLLCPIKYCHC